MDRTNKVVEETAITASPIESAPFPRYHEMDVVRGLAVLGILAMNITSFAYVHGAYFNPTVQGDLTGIHFVVWMIQEVFFNGKFVVLFSLLFGAGLYLVAERREARGEAPIVGQWPRLFWLGVIGLLHAYLIWYGDILFPYAIAGVLALFFWRARPRTLVLVGGLFYVVSWLLYLAWVMGIKGSPPETLEWMKLDWNPPIEWIEEETAAFRGNWFEQMGFRTELALYMHLFLPYYFYWVTVGLFLWGMALVKHWVLNREVTVRQLRFQALLWGSLGLALTLFVALFRVREEWDFFTVGLFGNLYDHWACLPLALGYFFGVCAVVKAGLLPILTTILSAVGRLALTNYLMQTVICTSLFYGHGLGLFGQLQRGELAAIVVLIWIFQALFSVLWVRYIGQGPAEFVWRLLSGSRRGHF